MKLHTTAWLVFSLCCSGAVNAQAPADTTIDGKIFTKVDEEASFPGGQKGWVSFLSKSLGSFSPSENGSPYGKFTVLAQFIVDTDGSLSEIKALTNFGYGMEEKVIQVLSKSGAWLPAMLNGKPIRAYRKQPITFIEEEDGFNLSTKTSFTLFTGMDNRITVEAKKLSNLRLTITEGAITREDGENFIARVSKPGWVMIDVYKGSSSKKLYSFSFEVKAPK